MTEEKERKCLSDMWMLRYIVTAETAVLITAATFFFTQYTSFVKVEQLAVIAPYVKDREAIIKHITKSEDILVQLGQAVHGLNMQLVKNNALLEIRLAKIEAEQQSKRR